MLRYWGTLRGICAYHGLTKKDEDQYWPCGHEANSKEVCREEYCPIWVKPIENKP